MKKYLAVLIVFLMGLPLQAMNQEKQQWLQKFKEASEKKDENWLNASLIEEKDKLHGLESTLGGIRCYKQTVSYSLGRGELDLENMKKSSYDFATVKPSSREDYITNKRQQLSKKQTELNELSRKQLKIEKDIKLQQYKIVKIESLLKEKK